MTTTQPIINNNLTQNPYLVTTAVNTEELPTQKIDTDLDTLIQAEEKSNYKADIARGISNPQLYRAMSALRINNPFKGV
jgi:hypothetical protein